MLERIRRPYLPLIFALIAAAVLFLPTDSTPPAEAQSAVWDTDLTVRQLDGGQDHDNDPTTPRTRPTKFGCDNGNSSEFPELGKCSTGSLTDDEFNFGGTFYTVTTVELQPDESGGRLTIRFNKGASAALKRATLRVGSLTLKMSEASYSGSNTRALWDNTGLDWDLAEHVRFSLTPGTAPAAQPTGGTLWSATLTTHDQGSGAFGCGSGTGPTSCGEALTDNTIVLGGVTYTVDVFFVGQSNELQFQIATHNIPEALKAYTLRVGNTNFLIGDGQVAANFVLWQNTSLTWTAGQTIQVSLVPTRDDWQSWNPTLTLRNTGGTYRGCRNPNAQGLTRCDNPATLTDDDFVFGGKTYSFASFSFYATNAPSSIISYLSSNIPEEMKDLTLQVDNTKLNLRDGKAAVNYMQWNAKVPFDRPDTGDKIKLRLLKGPPKAPFELKLEPGGSGRITATWFAPLAGGQYTSAITGYEVAYRRLDGNRNVAGDWVSRRVGRSTRATISGLDNIYTYQVRVRALSASGPGPWNKPLYKDYEVGAPGTAPFIGAATPLRILSASRSTVREGDAAITITARLARNAEADRVIHIWHGSNHGLANDKVQDGLTLATVADACTPLSPDRDYTLSPASITILQGQRTGTATLTVCDDTTEDSGEYISLRPDIVPPAIPEAIPTSGSGVYQVQALQIIILNDETGHPPDTGQAPDPGTQEPVEQPQEQPVAGEQGQQHQQPLDTGGTGSGQGVYVARYIAPNALLSFDSEGAAPGETITVKGSGFTGWTPLQSVRIGGVEAFPGGWVITDPDGKFSVDVVVPGLSAGTQQVIVTVGGWSGVGYLTVEAEATEETTTPAQAFANLYLFLDVVWHFDSASSTWRFYDPQFPDYSTLKAMESGKVYIVKVKSSVAAMLGGETRTLTCMNGNCWNQIIW